jgi:hypothetical protein
LAFFAEIVIENIGLSKLAMGDFFSTKFVIFGQK